MTMFSNSVILCFLLISGARLAYLKAETVNGKALSIPCLCSFPSCSCCGQFTLLDPNMTAVQVGCADVTFDRDNLGVRLQLRVAGRTLYDNEVSVVNPPPICVSPPMLPVIGFCAQLYDVLVNSDAGNVCLRLKFQILRNDAALLDLQCLHLEDGMLTVQTTV